MKRGAEESFASRLRNIKTSFILVFLFLFCFLYPLAFHNFELPSGELSEYLNNPVNVINDKTLYGDFFVTGAPLETYYPALLYSIFGIKILALFISSWLFGAGCTVLVFLISLKLMRNKGWAILTSLAVFFSGMIFHYSRFEYGGHIYLFFLLLATLIFVNNPYELNKPKLLGIGALVGLASGFRLDLAIGYLIALCITIGYMKKKGEIDRRKSRPYFINILIGSLIMAAITYLPFASHLPEVMKQSLFAFFTFDAMSNSSWIMTIYGLAYLIFSLIAIGLFVMAMGSRMGIPRRIPLVLLFSWALFSLPSTIASPSVASLSIPNSILILLFMIVCKDRVFVEEGKFKKISAAIIIILLIAVPLVNLVTYIQNIGQTYVVEGDQDRIYLKDEQKASELRSIVKIINNRTLPGESIFVAPSFAPPIYEITGRKNPTSYESLELLTKNPDFEAQATLCTDLIRGITKVVIYGTNCQYYRNGECQTQGIEKVDECIAINYKKLEEIGPYSIYVRK